MQAIHQLTEIALTHCSVEIHKYLLALLSSLLSPGQISISPTGGVAERPAQYHKYNFIVWSIFSTTIQLAALSPGTRGDHHSTIFKIQPIYLTISLLTRERGRESVLFINNLIMTMTVVESGNNSPMFVVKAS